MANRRDAEQAVDVLRHYAHFASRLDLGEEQALKAKRRLAARLRRRCQLRRADHAGLRVDHQLIAVENTAGLDHHDLAVLDRPLEPERLQDLRESIARQAMQAGAMRVLLAQFLIARQVSRHAKTQRLDGVLCQLQCCRGASVRLAHVRMFQRPPPVLAQDLGVDVRGSVGPLGRRRDVADEDRGQAVAVAGLQDHAPGDVRELFASALRQVGDRDRRRVRRRFVVFLDGELDPKPLHHG